ncbi:ABC transporter permease [Glycomyces buryatensis]|uniref:ABC transporter permease n=1 Tax=Glycomyces buryatensis TaxID=2570927 RepID=A0A4S8QGU0_9ACTN|nr:ABC transporter permease [Glycomyces buryatensis]THV42941.1 ABC transporter permease [Glycomyces buryatensis]
MTTDVMLTADTVGQRRENLYFALRNPKVLIGLTIVVGLALLGVIGPFFLSATPNEYIGPKSEAPSADHWLGTTYFGQDVFTQFVHGLRSSYLVGSLGGLIAFVIGMSVGFTAGYRGGLVDEFLNMLTNVVLVLPALAVLIVISSYLEVRGVISQAVIIGLFSWPWVARAVRAQTFTLRNRDYVDLAKLTGKRPGQIIMREIMPNMASYLLMSVILLFGGAILFAAMLDFIGMGPSNSVSLGSMMQQAMAWSSLHLGLWWWFVPPGAAITLIVGGLYITNVGLDEVFNPKLREK